MMHLGACCVCILLCVCIWLSPCRDFLFVFLNSADTSVNALNFARITADFVLSNSKLFTEVYLATFLQILECCNKACYGSP